MSDETSLRPIILQIPGLADVTFTDVQEVRNWHASQRNDWSPLLSRNFQPPLEQVKQRLNSSFVSLQNAIANFDRSEPSSEARKSHWDSIDNSLSEWRNRPWLVSQTVDGQDILQSAQIDPIGTLLRISVLVGHNLQIQIGGGNFDFKSVVRQIAPLVRDFALNDVAVERREVTVNYIVTALQERIETVVGDGKSKLATLVDQLDELKTEYDRQANALIELNTKQENRITKLRQLVNEALRNARESYRTLNETYKRHLQLEAPATFWQKRSSENRATALLMAAFFVIFAVGFGWTFFYYKDYIKAFVSDSKGDIQLGAIALIGPVAIVVVWIFRMVSKVFILSISEYLDASQRAVMVTTFLALTKDKSTHISEAERFIILQALFRSGSAKSEDDQIPSSALDVVARMVQGHTGK